MMGLVGANMFLVIKCKSCPGSLTMYHYSLLQCEWTAVQLVLLIDGL